VGLDPLRHDARIEKRGRFGVWNIFNLRSERLPPQEAALLRLAEERWIRNL
jgi:hypothetical protein